MTQPRLSPILLLIPLLALAALVRAQGIGWDGYASLHPDERHLFMVTQEMFRALADPAQAGRGLAGWLAEDSPLNPHLGPGHYVYGEAPLLAGMLAGWWLGATDWFAFMPVARALAVAVDTAAVLAVFLGARLLAGIWAALAAAVLYAAMPSALQLANFHTVDVWLSASTAAMLAALMTLRPDRPMAGRAALAGVFWGLALACKITGLLMGLPFALALFLAGRHRPRAALAAAGLALLAALAVFRLVHPFAFGAYGVLPSAAWIEDFRALAFATLSPDFPPNWQWIAGYGVHRFLRDFALFGIGPVAVLLMLGLRRPNAGQAVSLATAAVFLALAMLSSVSALRYGAPALPALAIALAPVLERRDARLVVGLLAAALWWGAGAVALHDGRHPRLLASHWLWTLPRGTVLTNETDWDEHLPAIVALTPGEPHRWPGHDDWFEFQVLDITAPDSPEKADRIAALLARTDYLILSSDRHSAVMPRLPERFPLTTAHYAALASGEACFTPVLELDRGYPLPLFPFDDSWAQEPWRIYDHPPVRLYAREPCYDPAAYADRLRAALEGR